MPPQAPFESEEKCFKTFRVKLRIYVQGNCLVTKATLEVSAPPCLCEKESSHSSEENFDANSHACIFFMCACVAHAKRENYTLVMRM